MNKDDKNTLCRRIVETVGDAVIFWELLRRWPRNASAQVGSNCVPLQWISSATASSRFLDGRKYRGGTLPELQHEKHEQISGRILDRLNESNENEAV